MGLVETIAGLTASGLAPCEFRLTVLGSGCLYAEGVRCVKSFSETEIVLGLKNSCLKVAGEGLRIEKFCDGDAVIKGRLKLFERVPR